jgi:CARDB
VNDVERLAEALRQANAELQVDPAELADAMKRGHRRLVWRLLAVAVLSAVGAALLLSGGLAASQAIKNNRENTADDHGSNQPKGGEGKSPEKGKSGSGGGKGGKQGGHKGHKQGEKHKSHDRSERVKGGGTEAPEEGLPELVVIDVTESEVVVKNESSVAAESFYVLVTIPGTEFEEKLVFDKGLAGETMTRRKFEEVAPCGSEEEIVAEVDAGKSVTESEDENNSASTDCAELQNEEGEKERSSSSVDGQEAARRAM